jgi:hypothetical protein
MKKNPPMVGGLDALAAWDRSEHVVSRWVRVRVGIGFPRHRIGYRDFQDIGPGTVFSGRRVRCFQDVGYGVLLLTEQRCDWNGGRAIIWRGFPKVLLVNPPDVRREY